jgi:hypothetical protein
MPLKLINPCSRAGCPNRISAQNKSGVCTACQQGRTAHLAGAAPKKPRAKRRDSDGAVLDRVMPPPRLEDGPLVDDEAKAEQHAAIEKTDETWLAKFYRLHEALGLDPEAAIEEHCRAWVQETTARALGESSSAAVKPKRRAPTNGAALEHIGDDYERARAQAAGEGGHV